MGGGGGGGLRDPVCNQSVQFVLVYRACPQRLHVNVQIDGRWRLGQRFGLGDLVSYLSGKQYVSLMQGMRRPSMSLLRALTRNDDEMRCLLTELICSGWELATSHMHAKLLHKLVAKPAST